MCKRKKYAMFCVVLLGVCLYTAWAGAVDLGGGAGRWQLYLTGTTTDPTVGTDYDYNAATEVLTIKSATPMQLSSVPFNTSSGNKRIVIQSGVTADITLVGFTCIVDTAPGITVESGATLILRTAAGDATRRASSRSSSPDYPAIFVPLGARLIIDGDGVLYADNSNTATDFYCAVIGGSRAQPNAGEIIIKGGTITACVDAYGYPANSAHGAAIGGGSGGSATRIEIQGGTVNAYINVLNPSTAAAVGGGGSLTGNGGHLQNLIVSGGTLHAWVNGVSSGAVIGGGGSANPGSNGGNLVNLTVSGNGVLGGWAKDVSGSEGLSTGIGGGGAVQGGTPGAMTGTLSIHSLGVYAKGGHNENGPSGADIGTGAITSTSLAQNGVQDNRVFGITYHDQWTGSSGVQRMLYYPVSGGVLPTVPWLRGFDIDSRSRLNGRFALSFSATSYQWGDQRNGASFLLSPGASFASAPAQELYLGASTSPAGVPPRITSPDKANIVYGAGGTFQVSASGNPIPTFSLSGAPNGVTIGSNTGLITVADTVKAGTHTFTVIASNGTAPNARQTFTLTVGERSNLPKTGDHFPLEWLTLAFVLLMSGAILMLRRKSGTRMK